MATELLGKVKQNVPGGDLRIAATIADNVGDCTGTAADLFEYRSVMLVASLVLGKSAFACRRLRLTCGQRVSVD